jgi:hypothetical protein
MILSTVKVEDFDRFLNTFSTKGAEKRKQHGSQGSHVFRDPDDDGRVWVVFDLDEEGYNNLMSDPGPRPPELESLRERVAGKTTTRVSPAVGICRSPG